MAMAIHSQLNFSGFAQSSTGDVVDAGSTQRVFAMLLGIVFVALLLAAGRFGQSTASSATPETPRAERIIKTFAVTSPHHAAKPRLADANSQFGQL